MAKSKLYFLALVFLTVHMCFSQFLFAKEGSPYEAFMSGNASELQAIFSEIDSRFKKGEISEYQLLSSYKVFYQRDDIFRGVLNAWIKKYPKSSFAYLARGIYLRKLGEFKRGTNYISQVPQQNIDYMNQMHQLAKKDLKKALQLDPDSYMAVVHLLNIAQFEDDGYAAKKYLLMGDRIFPDNILVRSRYLIHLTPRWGGSYEKMTKFIKEEKRHGMSSTTEKLLIAIELDDQGEMAQEKKDMKLMISKYKEALILTEAQQRWVRPHYLRYSLQLCGWGAYQREDYCK